MPQPPKRFVGDPGAGRVPGGEKHLRLGGKFLGRSAYIQGELPDTSSASAAKYPSGYSSPATITPAACEVGGKEIHCVIAHPKS